MSRKTWIALGALTLAPLVYFAAFVLIVVAVVGPDGQSPGEPDVASAIRPFHIAVAVLIGALLAFYLWHARRRQPDPDERRRWTTRLVFGSVAAMPVYWWRELRPRDDGEPRGAPSSRRRVAGGPDPGRR